MTFYLLGALPYHVAGDEIEGNVHRWLWRYTCRHAAQVESASHWERAIYALLAGDVQRVYTVCETWQEFIWATCACYATLRQDQLLYDHLDQALDQRSAEPLDARRFVAQTDALTVRQLLHRAESAYFQARPSSKKDSYHRLIKYLVLNDIQEVFDELYMTMMSSVIIIRCYNSVDVYT